MVMMMPAISQEDIKDERDGIDETDDIHGWNMNDKDASEKSEDDNKEIKDKVFGMGAVD